MCHTDPGKEVIMKHRIQVLIAMVLAGVSILILFDYTASAQDVNIYRGELSSGSAKVGNLSSNELWLLYGEKGNRIVISTVVDKGTSPPEIYLYPPEGRKYEIHSEVVSNRSQVLEYKLDYNGKYEIIIHPCDLQEKTRYQVAYTTLTPGSSYTIQPDDPNGNLIVQKNLDKSKASKISISRSGGLVPVSILLDLATFGFGPVLFNAIEGLDSAFVGAVDLNNRVEVASRTIEEPAGQCNIMVSSVVSR
jgi:hypothetical protein